MAHVIAVYPGTFDPITLGHEDIVRRAARLFDQVVIAVATAHHKKTLFTLDERLALTRETLADLPQVRVEPFTGLVTVFAQAQGARVMVRGVRGVTDFDYEAQLAGMNRALVPEVDTVYLNPGPTTQHVSSTLVREISMLGGDVARFVSAPVLARLLEKRAQRT
ncbi:pantetheine-phosphate adenylyltransferase [Ottowia sp.]|uniref:pantetheine-phosphate adenylyltransferase n=1 Tax=Ottowia sp. TaxID=1898956 RepID=UPI0039E6563D